MVEELDEEIAHADVDEHTREELEEIEHEIEDIEEEIDDLQEKEQNLLSRFFQKIFGSSKKIDLEDDFQEEISIPSPRQEEKEALSQETKEVLRLLHKWLSKLSPEQIHAFRRSEDFNRYKDLLEAYGIVKK